MPETDETLDSADRVLEHLHRKVALIERDIGQLRMLLAAQRSEIAQLRARAYGYDHAL